MKKIKKTYTEDQINRVKSALKIISDKTPSTKRESLYDRYMGEPYGDEVEGLSKYISTDVSDVVETLFAEAMEALTNDETIVEFVPSSPEDEEPAKQETALVHNLFRDQNDSFEVISTWFKEGLIEQNAYVRSGWVDKTRVIIEEYEDLDLDQFMLVYSNIVNQPHDYEIESLDGVDIGPDDIPRPQLNKNGEPKPIGIRARIVKKTKEYKIEPIPQDEMVVCSYWTKPTLVGCPAYGHKARKSKSELKALGFSEDCISKLAEETMTSSATNRHYTKNNDNAGSEADDKNLRLLGVIDGYVLADIDDDGIDELVNVWSNYDGSVILTWKDGTPAIKEVEKGPFSSWSPYIVPHRHVGRSVAELASTIQNLKTVLWRHLLDSIYFTNHPRPEVNEDLATEDTYNDLNSTTPGAPIRTLGNAITWQKPPAIVGDMLPILEKADDDLEKRAGATRYAQGAGQGVFNNSQVGSQGVAQILDASMRRMQVIIRTFAETGLRDLFYNIHADLRRGPNRELARKIRGNWVSANPIEWRERADMTVRIGTGKGDRQAKVISLERSLVEIKEGLAQGIPLYTVEHLYNATKALFKAMGVSSPDLYIMPLDDPKSIKMQQTPPPPDPSAEAALELAKAEGLKAQAAMVKAENEKVKVSEEAKTERASLELDVQIAAAKAREAEANLEIKQIELQLRKLEIDNKNEQAETMAQLKAAEVLLKDQKEPVGGNDVQ